MCDHWSSVATETTSHRSGVSVAYTPCGAAHGLRLPSRASAFPYAVHSTMSSAEMLSAASNMVDSTSEPTPVRSRSSSATSAPTTACMPPFGSQGPRWMRG